MIYFEDAKLEFFGYPVAYLPYLSAPDPTVKRKSGFLPATISTSSVYGVGVAIPYYWALAPNYDATITPLITTKQGPLLQGEWRQRLINGSYSIRASGLFQLDKDYFLNRDGPGAPGYRDIRGGVETSGQFSLTNKWVWGWDGTLVSDKSYFQDYRVSKPTQTNDPLKATDYALSQLYLAGRGDRSYFDVRSMYFYGYSGSDTQGQLPIIHPVMDHDYTVGAPVFGGELSFHSNVTSLSRASANFDPISQSAFTTGVCGTATADPAVKNSANCLLRGVPGVYSRASVQADWRRTVVDPFGQVFTPFLSVRGDLASLQVQAEPGVSNFMKTGDSDLARVMPTAGLEYRYPFISVHSWGTQTIEPIAQVVLRPNETKIGAFPNEDAQSLVFDDSNLLRVNKFSGWDREEGGGRLNAAVQYTAQFNRAGFVNVLFGQSYQLFGLNSFAAGGTTNTGINSGLDTSRSDYVARASYQPNSTFTFTSRFRFGESDFTLQRTELETAANFGRFATSVTYGNYAAQPALGFLDRREGILGTGKLKFTENWQVFGTARYDIRANKVNQTTIGIGYVDDCLILALNYITDYAYSTSTTLNHTIMMQLSLRTLGGNSVGMSSSALSTGVPGVTGK